MPQPIRHIGPAPFDREDIKRSMAELVALLGKQPIANNHGGMRAPHLLAAWYMIRELQPKHIVESGVFKGQGTWLLEQAAPEAKLYCIEPSPKQIEYRSARAEYFTADFETLDWSKLPREETLLFFDDHQNALSRVRAAEKQGFRHLMFEDNYPLGRGDCYSLKRAFMGDPEPGPAGIAGIVSRLRAQLSAKEAAETQTPSAYLESVLDTYFEFPPAHQPATTRWGDAWTQAAYPTPEPLLQTVEEPHQQCFFDQARDYTWLCYARLR